MILVKYPTQKEAVAAALSTPPELGMRFCADTTGGKRLIWPPSRPGRLPDIVDTPPEESDPAVSPHSPEAVAARLRQVDEAADSAAADEASDGDTEAVEAVGGFGISERNFDDAFADDIDPGDAVDDED